MSDVRFIEPTTELKQEFRDTVYDCLDLTALSPRVQVWEDFEGCGVRLESDQLSPDTRQRLIIETEYYLDNDDKLSKTITGDPLGVILAQTIKSKTVNPEPSRFDQDAQYIQEVTGCSELDAQVMAIDGFLMTEAGERAVKGLKDFMEALHQANKLGFNDVDAFELAGVIRHMHLYFPRFAA